MAKHLPSFGYGGDESKAKKMEFQLIPIIGADS